MEGNIVQFCLLGEIDKTYTVDLTEQEQWLKLQSGSVRVLINYFWQCSVQMWLSSMAVLWLDKTWGMTWRQLLATNIRLYIWCMAWCTDVCMDVLMCGWNSIQGAIVSPPPWSSLASRLKLFTLTDANDQCVPTVYWRNDSCAGGGGDLLTSWRMELHHAMQCTAEGTAVALSICWQCFWK